jgi:hypothetical protein
MSLSTSSAVAVVAPPAPLALVGAGEEGHTADSPKLMPNSEHTYIHLYLYHGCIAVYSLIATLYSTYQTFTFDKKRNLGS